MSHYQPKLDYARAHRQGWTLAITEVGVWTIQKYWPDPLDTFQDDGAAYEFVLDEAEAGSPDHREAFILDGKKVSSLSPDFDLNAVVYRLFDNLTPINAKIH